MPPSPPFSTMYTPVAVLLLVVFIHSGECGLWLEDQRLTGWKGETYFPEEVAQKDARIQTLSHKPRAFFYHNMLSERETSHLISLAAPYMKRSMVYGGGNGGVYSERSSLGTFLWRMQDPVIAGIQNKVAQWTGIPSSHQEMIQVELHHGFVITQSALKSLDPSHVRHQSLLHSHAYCLIPTVVDHL